MEGEITAQSQYGKGSIFTAVLVQKVVDWKPMGDLAAIEAPRAERQRVTFIAPEAEVLVADDFPSNLLVAEGLLKPYQIRVFTCLNGREAVTLVRDHPFDLVLMDHMMPEMDGIEAASAIRSMDEPRCHTLPIVALTANAVSGMKEMFLENGFDDFLSKPIEMDQLDVVLKRWIPENKCQAVPESDEVSSPEELSPQGIPEIAGVNTAAGLARIRGSQRGYLDLLDMLRRDVEAGLPVLEKELDQVSLPAITTLVHALKSALATVGAEGLSLEAACLEKAGREANWLLLRAQLPPFRERLAQLSRHIGERALIAQAGSAPIQTDPACKEVLLHLREALETKDIKAAYATLAQLQALPLSEEIRGPVAEIADAMLNADFPQAKEAVSNLLI
jgi:CheY-like chemotaxis protein